MRKHTIDEVTEEMKAALQRRIDELQKAVEEYQDRDYMQMLTAHKSRQRLQILQSRIFASKKVNARDIEDLNELIAYYRRQE